MAQANGMVAPTLNGILCAKVVVNVNSHYTIEATDMKIILILTVVLIVLAVAFLIRTRRKPRRNVRFVPPEPKIGDRYSFRVFREGEDPFETRTEFHCRRH